MEAGIPEIRPDPVVLVVAERDDGVQAVVATGQLDDDQDPLGTALGARALERLRRQCGRRPVEQHREPGRDPDAVQPLPQEITPRAPTAVAMANDHRSSLHETRSPRRKGPRLHPEAPTPSRVACGGGAAARRRLPGYASWYSGALSTR